MEESTHPNCEEREGLLKATNMPVHDQRTSRKSPRQAVLGTETVLDCETPQIEESSSVFDLTGEDMTISARSITETIQNGSAPLGDHVKIDLTVRPPEIVYEQRENMALQSLSTHEKTQVEILSVDAAVGCNNLPLEMTDKRRENGHQGIGESNLTDDVPLPLDHRVEPSVNPREGSVHIGKKSQSGVQHRIADQSQPGKVPLVCMTGTEQKVVGSHPRRWKVEDLERLPAWLTEREHLTKEEIEAAFVADFDHMRSFPAIYSAFKRQERKKWENIRAMRTQPTVQNATALGSYFVKVHSCEIPRPQETPHPSLKSDQFEARGTYEKSVVFTHWLSIHVRMTLVHL